MERMTKKLLPKTLRVYILFSLIVILTAGPLFYFITQWFYIKDTNETLLLTKKSFTKYTLPQLNEQDIPSFNRLNWNIKILDANFKVKSDVYKNEDFTDSLEQDEDELFHVLLSPIRIENKKHTLMVRINMIESDNLVESIALVFMTIIILLVIGLIIITRRLSQQLWKPFYDSLYQTENFEIDKNNIPHWQTTNIEEFTRLNKAIDTLIERNVAIYKSQREFIENAAHELQTPLAAFQAKLENLMQTGSITRYQAIIIDDLIGAVSRLTRLNKNLLLLSKLHKGLFPDNEEISINTLLEKQINFFNPQAETKNITCTANMEDLLIVRANRSLLESMLSNLFLNAIRHNHEKGSIYIELKEGKLKFFNTGRDEPLNSSVIFKRFSNNDRPFIGSGLGLSIVKRIADLYQWNISYTWKGDLHCFEVEF